MTSECWQTAKILCQDLFPQKGKEQLMHVQRDSLSDGVALLTLSPRIGGVSIKGVTIPTNLICPRCNQYLIKAKKVSDATIHINT